MLTSDKFLLMLPINMWRNEIEWDVYMLCIKQNLWLIFYFILFVASKGFVFSLVSGFLAVV